MSGLLDMIYLQVSHGAGSTLEGSHNSAAHTALKSLASTGLDGLESAAR